MRAIGIPFLYKGVKDVSGCKTSAEAIKQAGLDWEVIKTPLFACMERKESDDNREDGFTFSNGFFKQIQEVYSINRTDINEPLGVVRSKYEIVQNSEAFSFIDSVARKNKIEFVTAGCYGLGEKIFVSAKLPAGYQVGGKDDVDNYIIFSTTHDGSSGIRVCLSPIRLRCFNQLNAAFQHSPAKINIRHTISAKAKLELASMVLSQVYDASNTASEVYNAMYKCSISDDEAMKQFAIHVLGEDEFNRIASFGFKAQDIVNKDINVIESTGISMKKMNTIIDMNDYYHIGVAQQEIVGSVWGVYGAITGYYSNVDKNTGFKRFDSLTFGDRNKKIEAANKQLIQLL